MSGVGCRERCYRLVLTFMTLNDLHGRLSARSLVEALQATVRFRWKHSSGIYSRLYADRAINGYKGNEAQGVTPPMLTAIESSMARVRFVTKCI